MQTLQTLEPGDFALPVGINELGQAVGTTQRLDLSTSIAVPFGMAPRTPLGINNGGELIGPAESKRLGDADPRAHIAVLARVWR